MLEVWVIKGERHGHVHNTLKILENVWMKMILVHPTNVMHRNEGKEYSFFHNHVFE